MNRGAGCGVRFNNSSAGLMIKQWRGFLSEAHNKTMLLEFITEEWKSGDSNAIIGNKRLYVTCVQKFWEIKSAGRHPWSSSSRVTTRLPPNAGRRISLGG